MFIFGNMKVASLSFEAEVNKGMRCRISCIIFLLMTVQKVEHVTLADLESSILFIKKKKRPLKAL